jgi:light-regulated signal transduction histidine kinase (bacteriophytochrome)
LFVRVIMFSEGQRAAYLLALVSAALYFMTLTIRATVQLPQLNAEGVYIIVLYVLPALLFGLFTLLDQVGTYFLRNALQFSEEARTRLTHSYEKLAQSQQALAHLASKLEQSNQELHEVNEELKSFTYLISHDLRSPLLNLHGFAGELRHELAVLEETTAALLPQLDAASQRRLQQTLHKDIPEALGFIESSVIRMDSFIAALLKLSRYGRRDLQFTAVNMNEIVQTTLNTLAHQLNATGVEQQIAPLPTIMADTVSMEQIMSNLLNNALNYLDSSRPGQIAVWAEENETETIFHVQDNGRGIASEDMSKLFKPFQRLGQTDVPGEGVGLAYVQTLVWRHNGRIWCESEPGVGSAFIFTIPRGDR